MNLTELFKLVGSIIINTSEAIEAIKDTSSKAGQLGDKMKTVGTKIVNVGNDITGIGKKLMPVTVGIGGLGVASIKTAADFEASMSQVAATMGMTAEEINNGSEEYAKLEQAARDCGKSTKFSAEESAQALNYLALAGYDVDTSIAMLPKVLNLAAAGGIDLAYASDMVTDSMSALGLEVDEADGFIDQMAVTSQKSNTSVAQLGEAILTVGGTAKTLAGGTTELNTALGILADNGVKGAEGGTALRNIILSLSAPTDKAADMMRKLGLEVYDAEGNMRPMNDIFNDLNGIMSDMTQGEQTNVLNTIFNKVDLKSANALLANSNERFNELSGYISECDGAAQDMADTMQNNLNGQLTTLKSALSEAAISIGQQLIPIIKDAVTFIQDWTDKFNSLDDSQKQTIIKVALLVASIAPLLIVLGSCVSGIGELIVTFATLDVAMLPVIAIVGSVVATLAVMAGAFVTLWKKSETFRTKMTSLANGIESKFQELSDKVVELFSSMGFECGSFFDIIKTLWNVFCKFIEPNLTAFLSAIGNIISTFFDIVIGVLDIFIGIFSGDWSKCWDGIKRIATSVLDGFKTSFKIWVDFAKGLFQNFLSILDKLFGDTFDKIKSAVSGAIESVKTTFSNGIDTVKSKATSILGNIVDTFKDKFETVKTTVKDAVDKLKGFMNFEWNLPKLKMPHFTASGEFSLNPLKVPKFDIQWYKKAMDEPYVFTKPTIVGSKGFGDAGDEMVYGKNNLMNDIKEASQSDRLDDIYVLLQKFIEVFTNNLDKQVVLDSGVLVGELTPLIDKSLGNINRMRVRGA